LDRINEDSVLQADAIRCERAASPFYMQIIVFEWFREVLMIFGFRSSVCLGFRFQAWVLAMLHGFASKLKLAFDSARPAVVAWLCPAVVDSTSSWLRLFCISIQGRSPK